MGKSATTSPSSSTLLYQAIKQSAISGSRQTRSTSYILADHSLPKPTTPINTNLRSLQQVLQEGSGDPTQEGFPFGQRITLAKQLAQAVLHFHKTAWLRDSWDSRTILVRGKRASDTVHSGADTALELFATTNIYGQTADHQLASTLPNPLVIRNRLLFSLGVVLIELAYGKLLASLVDPIDRVGTAQQDVPYRTADRLSKRISSKMGPKYSEMRAL